MHAFATRPGFGVAYLLTDLPLAARMVVSLVSLRQWYDGPITVFTTRAGSHAVGGYCAEDPQLAIEHATFDEVDCGETSSYLTKVALMKAGPYEETLFLDADTLVTGELTDLINAVRCSPLTVTYAGRATTETPWFRRFVREQWRELQTRAAAELGLGNLLDMAENISLPGINTGVLGVRRDADILEPWSSLTQLGSTLTIPDEVALQLLLPRYEYHMVGQRFNCWPLHYPHVRDVRIWHFVGSSHLRMGKSVQLWRPAYEACFERNTAQITRWSKVVFDTPPAAQPGR